MLHWVVADVAHGFVEVQAAPALHGVQVPVSLHTPAVPLIVQAVPTGAVDVTVQTGPDAVQLTVAPVAHGFAEVQVAPHRWKLHVARSVPVPLPEQSIV